MKNVSLCRLRRPCWHQHSSHAPASAYADDQAGLRRRDPVHRWTMRRILHSPARRTGLDDEPLGAIFYLHGHRGKAVNAIRNQGFQRMADKLGVAFVAVQGVNGTWSFPTAPRNLRDESVFFDNGPERSRKTGSKSNRDKTMLSGFSSGGLHDMVPVACENSQAVFPGMRRSQERLLGAACPNNCPTDNPYLFHVHGTSDTVVPLAGRWLGGGQVEAGRRVRKLRCLEAAERSFRGPALKN